MIVGKCTYLQIHASHQWAVSILCTQKGEIRLLFCMLISSFVFVHTKMNKAVCFYVGLN